MVALNYNRLHLFKMLNGNNKTSKKTSRFKVWLYKVYFSFVDMLVTV